jgi:hypothetical protein
MITLEALRVLKNQLNFARHVNRKYSREFGIEGKKIGDTLQVRKPPRYIGRRGPALQVEDITQTSVPVVINQQYGCDINFSAKDRALSIERFSEDIIGPAVASIANSIDSDGTALYKTVAANVGIPATTPNALLTYLLAGVALDNASAPVDGSRYICITPLMQATIVDALKGLFQSSEKISQQYEKGKMGIAAGFQWFMDQNMQTHTIGALGGSPQIDGANQTGSSINVKGWTAAVGPRLKAGDIVTFVGVNQVNTQSRQSVGTLQTFTVTADFASDVSGKGALQISPPLTPSGQMQTVTASPADSANIVVFPLANGTSSSAASTATPQGLAFHKDAFTFACVDLELPRGVDMASRIMDPDLNISMRLVRAYDINQDKYPCRLDVLGGWATLRQELACRISA